MEFFYKDNNIKNKIIEYQLVFKHQYFPSAWIKFKNFQDYTCVKIVHKDTTIFYGNLVESFMDYEESVTIGLFVTKDFYHHCLDKNYEEIYQTYETFGGYFQDNIFKIQRINWKRQNHWKIIKFFDYKIKSIPTEPLNVKVINNINGDFFYEIHKEISLITPLNYTERHLLDFLYKNLKEDIILENYSLDPSIETNGIHWTGSVDFLQSIPIKIKESWQSDSQHQNLIVLMDNKTINTDEAMILSSIDGNYINKIKEASENYQNFSWIIHIKTDEWLWVGQPVSLNIAGVNYYGFVIKIILENYNNQWLIKGVVKAYDQWTNFDNQYNIPKNFSLDLTILEQNWQQWHWVYDGGLVIQWPQFKSLYQSIHHK